MSTTNFNKALEAQRKASGSGLCIGQDINVDVIPPQFESKLAEDPESTVYDFQSKIIVATAPYADCWKPNMAFYEGLGSQFGFDGLRFLLKIIEKLTAVSPEVPIILDGKRGDIGATNVQYARFFQRTLEINPSLAITLNPYFGPGAYDPFLDLGITIFWLIRTSNKGSDVMQKKKLESGLEVWQQYLHEVISWEKIPGQCGAVIGATHPDEMIWVMENAPTSIPILSPGLGTQGGDVNTAASLLRKFPRAIINSSSAIMGAGIKAGEPENFAELATQKAKETADSLK